MDSALTKNGRQLLDSIDFLSSVTKS
jgi:hypothetical protein